MKRILAAAALCLALAGPAFAQTQIPGGGGSSGVTSVTCGGTTITTTGNCGALTGDVTAAAGSGVTTLANIPAISGANLTNLNGTNIATGTVAIARGGTGTGTATGSGSVVLATSPSLVTPALGVATGTSVAINGTAGAGYVEFGPQSAQPSTPAANTFRIFANASGKFTWIGANGFLRVFDGTANTADRTYTLPDVTGTVTVLGNASTGSGSVVLATSPSLTTPTLGAASGTSLALGGASIGTDALGVTGTTTLGSKLTLNGNGILTSPAAATLQHGAADAASPVAQTEKVQDVVAGTTNTAGTNWTFQGSAGTGTGAGGSIIFQVAPAGSTGTAKNTWATALTINSAQQTSFSAGSASLPSLNFGDSSTGLYKVTTNQIGVTIAGTLRWYWNSTNFQGNAFDSVLLINSVPSGTVPNIIPRGSDTKAGIGADADGDVSIIANKAGTATEVIRATGSSVTITPGIIAGGTAPTLTGTCTTGSQVGGNTAGAFAATCTAQTVIVTFATTAPNGWVCDFNDITTPADAIKQTAYSTTSCTATGTTVASDVITFHAIAF